MRSRTPPFTPVKIEKDFGPRNSRLGSALFPQRQSTPIVRIPVEVEEKGKRRIFEEEDLPPVKSSLTFDSSLGDYIPLVDPMGLPLSNYLPSIDTLALLDRVGRRWDQSTMEPTTVQKHSIVADVEGDKIVDGGANLSDGAAKAVLLGRPPFKTPHAICIGPTLIDLNFDDNEDDCKIVYSIPGSSV